MDLNGEAMGRVIMWDFDGTLAERPGLWSQTMVEVLDLEDPDHGVVRDDLRPALQDGRPWHRADQAHPELNEPDAWWLDVGRLLASAYRSVGYDKEARRLAGLVREHFLDPAAWQVFDDTRPALESLTDQGWSDVIFSNHVPELADLVETLGLAPYFTHVVTSARVGYDKPHPAIYHTPLS